MKQKYNIALIPVTKRLDLIRYAENFTTLKDKYLLGKKSLPHVTLCHFTTDEAALPQIWAEVNKHVQPKKITLKLEKLVGSQTARSCWAMLLPDHREELTRMHYAVAAIIKHPLNYSFENYYPHLSLVNTQNKNYLNVIQEAQINFVPFADEFIISLGRSDEIGQYTDLIYS